MAYLIVDSSTNLQPMGSQSKGPTPIFLHCNAVTVGHPSSSLFSTDSPLHLFTFITFHYISLHFPALFFGKIAEFFKNSRVRAGLLSEFRGFDKKTCGNLVKRWRNFSQGSGSGAWLGM
jgi:hypothetical protein